MKHSSKNIFFHELVGLKVRIVNSLNPTQVGLSGKIIWETKRSIVVQTGSNHIVRLLKKEVFLEIELPDKEKVYVSGDYLFGDPIERAKRIKRVKWR